MKELYTETSQYRNWNYTKEKLQETRKINHKLAVKRVKKKIMEESILQKQMSESSSPAYSEQGERVNSPRVNSPNLNPSEIEYLTVEDELALFTCLFLAAKSEHSFVSIDEFVKVSKVLKTRIFELELVVSGSLRYEYTVHHPFISAFGYYLDMQNVIKDTNKIKSIYEKSIGFIKASILTDAMFIYQPSQIALAALRMAAKQDKFDLSNYLRYKFKSDSPKKVESLYKILDDIDGTIKNQEQTTFEQAKLIDKRLLRCKNPEKNPNSAISRKRRLDKEASVEAERRKKKKHEDEYQKETSSVFN
ncbi:10616_t:CDS:2 [Diversispora eburnea]|uniref:10616_t:CDS:1 n=1 Tax=Diversispora eburnea TaxID=1213867 RepID=A0A9N8WBW1_9GLOM|nr:10616_t:CDS:2 [Diversispora eburnea]